MRSYDTRLYDCQNSLLLQASFVCHDDAEAMRMTRDCVSHVSARDAFVEVWCNERRVYSGIPARWPYIAIQGGKPNKTMPMTALPACNSPDAA